MIGLVTRKYKWREKKKAKGFWGNFSSWLFIQSVHAYMETIFFLTSYIETIYFLYLRIIGPMLTSSYSPMQFPFGFRVIGPLTLFWSGPGGPNTLEAWRPNASKRDIFNEYWLLSKKNNEYWYEQLRQYIFSQVKELNPKLWSSQWLSKVRFEYQSFGGRISHDSFLLGSKQRKQNKGIWTVEIRQTCQTMLRTYAH